MYAATKSDRAFYRPGSSASVRSWTLIAARTFGDWQQRMRTRRALASLDDRLLKDVGLNRADVWRECSKPFWKE